MDVNNKKVGENMADAILEALKQKMLTAEETLMMNLPNDSFEDLIELSNVAIDGILNSPERILAILALGNREYSQEAIFSTIRVVKAVLAEIEYRIRENKI